MCIGEGCGFEEGGGVGWRGCGVCWRGVWVGWGGVWVGRREGEIKKKNDDLKLELTSCCLKGTGIFPLIPIQSLDLIAQGGGWRDGGTQGADNVRVSNGSKEINVFQQHGQRMCVYILTADHILTISNTSR